LIGAGNAALSNGFTFVEAYLARGMSIDDFAPNLSFFFSYGMDPEYAVIGRVARRIWAVAMRERYGANERSQKLKFHSQTSGRSLHAQEIAFNDIRTTLQALISTYDNTNSLHTNAYDEAITGRVESRNVDRKRDPENLRWIGSVRRDALRRGERDDRRKEWDYGTSHRHQSSRCHLTAMTI
jgi:methylmalonyl-CoA mutase N-terminal domain/subunit